MGLILLDNLVQIEKIILIFSGFIKIIHANKIMGQSLDKLKISCMYCAGSLSTQEEDLNYSLSHNIDTYNNDIQTDEVIVFESPANLNEITHTQSSFINLNLSKGSESPTNYFLTHEKFRFPSHQKESFKSEPTNSSAQDNNFFFSQGPKKLSKLSQARYKSRSSNFSGVSINLVDSLRNKL